MQRRYAVLFKHRDLTYSQEVRVRNSYTDKECVYVTAWGSLVGDYTVFAGCSRDYLLVSDEDAIREMASEHRCEVLSISKL